MSNMIEGMFLSTMDGFIKALEIIMRRESHGYNSLNVSRRLFSHFYPDVMMGLLTSAEHHVLVYEALFNCLVDGYSMLLLPNITGFTPMNNFSIRVANYLMSNSNNIILRIDTDIIANVVNNYIFATRHATESLVNAPHEYFEARNEFEMILITALQYLYNAWKDESSVLNDPDYQCKDAEVLESYRKRMINIYETNISLYAEMINDTPGYGVELKNMVSSLVEVKEDIVESEIEVIGTKGNRKSGGSFNASVGNLSIMSNANEESYSERIIDE